MILYIKKALTNLTLSLLGFGIACIIVESVLQITDPTTYDRFQNDPVSGLLHYMPNSSFTDTEACRSVTVTTNSLGFHAPEPPPIQKATNIFRIIVVGSSFAEADSSAVDQTPSADLEKLLNAIPHRRYTYEVIPVAFSGNGTYLDILYYLRYGRPLSPDLVVDISTEYEVGRNISNAPFVPHFDSGGNLIVSRLPTPSQNSFTAMLKNIFRHSKLIMNVYNHYLTITHTPAPALGEDAPSTVVNTAKLQREWDQEKMLLDILTRYSAEDGAQFMVAAWTSPYAATTSVDLLHTNLAAAAKTSGFSYLDLNPPMDAQAAITNQNPSWACDPHWSPTGDAFAAQALYGYLLRHPTLLNK